MNYISFILHFHIIWTIQVFQLDKMKQMPSDQERINFRIIYHNMPSISWFSNPHVQFYKYF